ncbi:MAG: hypothetical protein H0U36_07720 [Nocardioidaceae bacterium]|nr:hypothetical protein [Nocardioidaceae bacterium]
MGLTGLIYAAIVVAWAAYLVPLALRRHDEAARSRSVERFSSAMRVLSRRGSASQDRVVLTPSRQSDRVQSPSLGSSAATTVVSEAQDRPTRAAQRVAARRRRRVLIVLVTLLVLVGVAAGLSLVAWWSVVIPAALVVGFLVVARRQVRKMEEAFWVTASQQRPEPSNVVRRTAARVDASAGVVRSGATTRADPDDEPTITLSAEQLAAAAPDLAEQRVLAVSMSTADGGSLWDPLPITLPTYVDKPVAKRTIRTIELGEPGTWSAGHSADDSRAAAAAASNAAEAKELVEQEHRAISG